MTRWARAVAVAALVCPAMAMAGGPVYFHKPGVTRDAFVAEYDECEELAGGVRVARTYVHTPNMVSVAAASFFAPFFESAERRRLSGNVLRTCMAEKGYRRVEASRTVRKTLKSLSAEQRVDHLFELAAAVTPEGEVLPR